MSKPFITEYYEEQIAAADANKYPDQTWDQTAMSQSAYGSHLMHTSLPKVVDLHRKVVLDLGCGTGSMYETLAKERGVLPKLVVGVDLMPKFGEKFLERAEALGFDALFREKPQQESFLNQHYGTDFDVVLMIGIVGFYGDHRLSYLQDLYEMGCGLTHASGAVTGCAMYRKSAATTWTAL